MSSAQLDYLELLRNQITSLQNGVVLSIFDFEVNQLQFYFHEHHLHSITFASISKLVKYAFHSPKVKFKKSEFIDMKNYQTQAREYFMAHFNVLESEPQKDLSALRHVFKFNYLNDREYFETSLKLDCFIFLGLGDYIRFDPNLFLTTRADLKNCSLSKELDLVSDTKRRKVWACEMYFCQKETRNFAKYKAGITENQMRRATYEWKQGKLK